MRLSLKIAALGLVLSAGSLWGAHGWQSSTAQDKKSEPPMQAPQPGPEMQRLHFLIGTWDWNAEYVKSEAMPEGGKETGWYKAQLGPGGFSLIADFDADGPMGKETGHEVLTWDPKKNAYTTMIVGNAFPGAVMGQAHWDGDKLVTDSQFGEGDQAMQLRSVYSNIRENTTHMEDFVKNPKGDYVLIWQGEATRK